MTTTNQTAQMTTGDFSTSNPIFSAHVSEQLTKSLFTETENGATALSNYGLKTQGETPSYVAPLVALSTELIRGNEAKGPIKKGVNRRVALGSIKRERLSSLVRNVFAEVQKNSNVRSQKDFLRGLIKSDGSVELNKEGQLILLDLIKICFNLRDIRGTYGKGERRLFMWMFIDLYKYIPTIMYWLMHEIPHYGSYKDLADLYEMVFVDNKEDPTVVHHHKPSKCIKSVVVDIFAMQLMKDKITFESISRGETSADNVSLAARWVPKEGRALHRATRRDPEGSVTSRIAQKMFPDLYASDRRKAMSTFRHQVSALNKHLDTVQIKMSAKEFRNINFKRLPGRATTKFQKAWKGVDRRGVFKHTGIKDRELCRDNRQQHLKLLEKGAVKAKGKQLHLHEIVTKLMANTSACPIYSNLSPDEITLYNAQFNSHVNNIIEFADKNGVVLPPYIPIADVSGSMTGDPMAVAIGMAILCSHKGIAHPVWENIVLPFSSTPND